MRSFLAALMLCVLTITLTTPADARSRHRHHAKPDREASLLVLMKRQARELDEIKKELAGLRKVLSPDMALAGPVPVPQPRNPVILSVPSIPDASAPSPFTATSHVFPATAVQRGQFDDLRPRHRHAGIDLAGAYGSAIVAAFGGVVLPAPGRDRGYGPHVIVIRGDDGIVYRYAHLSSVDVKIGQRVATGQRIGGMGHVGRHGRDHLHFEMIPVAEYRRRPYGVHSLDPNDYLGGGRGKRMMAGLPMTGNAATRYATAR